MSFIGHKGPIILTKIVPPPRPPGAAVWLLLPNLI